MNLLQSKAHARLVQFGVTRIKTIFERLDDALFIERRELKQQSTRGNLEVEQSEAIRDQIALLGEMSDTMVKLAFVGMYSLVEHRLKELMSPFATSKAELTSFYKIDTLKSVAKTRFNIDLEKRVKHYTAIDEIRLINNSVKHSAGTASPQLAKSFPRWKQGRPLNGLKADFKRLSPLVPQFFEDLARQLPNPPGVPPKLRKLP